MAAISGWGGRVSVNPTSGSSIASGTAMSVTRWSINNRADAVDATTMEHQGLEDAVSGVEMYDISFECIYDTTLNPFLATPNLNPGRSGGASQVGSNYITVTLTMDRGAASARSWYFPRVLITDASMDDEVRGVVRYTVQGKSTLGVTFVAGSTPTLGSLPAAPTANPG